VVAVVYALYDCELPGVGVFEYKYINLNQLLLRREEQKFHILILMSLILKYG